MCIRDRYYHLIQSFRPGEISPELALEIAREFAEEHLAGYQTVIGVHVDKEHTHAHILFNSVNADTGEKYHSNAQSYYRQIRATSDRLCREHGLSVLLQGEPSQAVSYIEWLRRSRGQPTFRSMLEACLLYTSSPRQQHPLSAAHRCRREPEHPEHRTQA